MIAVGLQYATRFYSLWQRTTDYDRARGHRWYSDAEEIVSSIAAASRHTVKEVAFAMAALSQEMAWERNIALCLTMAMSHRFQNPGTLKLVATRAWDCLQGNFDSLIGPKVNAFALNLTGDRQAVTIDRHMIRAATGKLLRAEGAFYDLLAEGLRVAAVSVGWSPREFQAVLWLAQREKQHPLPL
jgi:hypothetical protein